MVRNLKEFRIRGIKTNIPFLKNVVLHEQFKSGKYNTSFIDDTPELFVFPVRKDRGTKLLTYIADMSIKDRKSTRLNSSHVAISYAVFCLKKKTKLEKTNNSTRR